MIDKIKQGDIKGAVTDRFVIGFIAGITGANIFLTFLPKDAANALEGSMCGSAIAAQVEYHADEMKQCIEAKARCEGKIEVIGGCK